MKKPLSQKDLDKLEPKEKAYLIPLGEPKQLYIKIHPSGNDKGCVYELKIAGVKNDSEALNLANAKLNVLNKGAYEGSFIMMGKNIKAGANLEIKGIDERVIFSIKDVKHDLSLSAYTISVNFEG